MLKYVVLCVGHMYKPFGTTKFDQVGKGGQEGLKCAQEWPEFSFGAVQRSPNGSMAPVMDPKWPAQVHNCP